MIKCKDTFERGSHCDKDICCYNCKDEKECEYVCGFFDDDPVVFEECDRAY